MEKLKRLSVMIIVGFLLVAVSQPAIGGKGKVNINTATKKELVTLKHVGNKLADRIIEYRKAHPFKKSEEIMQVKGVGQKIYEVNKHLLTVKSE